LGRRSISSPNIIFVIHQAPPNSKWVPHTVPQCVSSSTLWACQQSLRISHSYLGRILYIWCPRYRYLSTAATWTHWLTSLPAHKPVARPHRRYMQAGPQELLLVRHFPKMFHICPCLGFCRGICLTRALALAFGLQVQDLQAPPKATPHTPRLTRSILRS
jgi:hypothetical protein